MPVRKRRTAGAWALAAAGWIVAAAGCGNEAAKGPPGPGGAGMPVKIEVARPVSVDDASEYVATLKSRRSAQVMPQVEGTVTEIFVRSGERVEQGAPLLQIDPAKQRAAVKSQADTRAAKLADLEYARQQYERVNGLFDDGISSKQDLDRAKAALDAAQAELEALEARLREEQVQLDYYRVEASTAGVVGDIPVRVGDRVTVSTLLTTVDSLGGLEAYVSVPVERAARLRSGTAVQLVGGGGEVLAQSRVHFISPRVDDETQTVLVKAGVADGGGALRTAQQVRARIVWNRDERLLVPVLAVSRIGGQHFAFVAEQQDGALVARQKPLRLGEIKDNAYVVLEGLQPGDKLIVSGTQFLMDGAPVSPQG